ncbi:MAG TPA: twin-arginine translocase TatA/TatE family subunit [Chloroflexia bacterium]|nr:twin-arginine translocase TatA/TatE family subunit [Chloroflexia bacterium]
MPSIGPTELILVLAIVLIIFGAGKLPQVLGSFGKGIKEFRDASEGKGEASDTAPAPPTRSAVASTESSRK